MTFPVVFHVWKLAIPAHPIFQVLGSFTGMRLYWKFRKPDRIPADKAVWVLFGALIGAVSGQSSWHGSRHPQSS